MSFSELEIFSIGCSLQHKGTVLTLHYSISNAFPQKQTRSDQTSTEAGEDKDKEKPSRPVQPYRRMLPGMKVKTDSDREEVEGEGGAKDEDEDEEEPTLPTPRKRLMNFKIPLVRGVGERRDQSLSVVRRRLFGGEGKECVGVWVCVQVCASVCAFCRLYYVCFSL